MWALEWSSEFTLIIQVREAVVSRLNGYMPGGVSGRIHSYIPGWVSGRLALVDTSVEADLNVECFHWGNDNEKDMAVSALHVETRWALAFLTEWWSLPFEIVTYCIGIRVNWDHTIEHQTFFLPCERGWWELNLRWYVSKIRIVVEGISRRFFTNMIAVWTTWRGWGLLGHLFNALIFC